MNNGDGNRFAANSVAYHVDTSSEFQIINTTRIPEYSFQTHGSNSGSVQLDNVGLTTHDFEIIEEDNEATYTEDVEGFDDLKISAEEALPDSLERLTDSLEIISSTVEEDFRCFCADTISDVALLHCGHIFCHHCISTSFQYNHRRCPYCRSNVNNQNFIIDSDELDQLIGELDYANQRLLGFKNRRSRTEMASRCNLSSYLSIQQSITDPYNFMQKLMNQNAGKTLLYKRLFPDSIYEHRRKKTKLRMLRNQSNICGIPWNDSVKMQDIIITIGFLLFTWIGMAVQKYARKSSWGVAQTFAVTLLYLWTFVVMTYTLVQSYE